MAEGYLRKYSDHNIYSAGIETHGLNKNAIMVMSYDDIDISNHTSNSIDEFKDIEFDHIITVCDHAKESCPLFISSGKRHHFNFTDPSKSDNINDYIIVRDQIKEYCIRFLKSI